MYHICRMLHVNRSITTLHLGKNSIGDYGAQLLAEYLGGNPSLSELDLRWWVGRHGRRMSSPSCVKSSKRGVLVCAGVRCVLPAHACAWRAWVCTFAW